MRNLFAASCLLLAFSSSAQTRIEKLWETESDQLRTPESVLVDAKTNSIYVSNIDGKPWEADGKGFISTLAANGVVQTLKWADGLNAPKGMGISKGKLYVADITEVAVIDVRTGQIKERLAPTGAVNLNDIDVAPNGEVYVTDSGSDRVYVIKGKNVSVFLESPELKRPNGIKFVGNKMYIISAGGGDFFEVNPDKTLKKLAGGMPSGDGIEPDGKNFLLSRWEGVLHYWHAADGKLEQLLDTRPDQKNCADIGFDKSKRVIYVPTFNGNTVAAYQIK